MTPDKLQVFLRGPFDAAGWLRLLRELLPTTEVYAQPQLLDFRVEHVLSARQLARIPLVDGRAVAVLEVRVSGQVDLQRNRVGLRQLVARFIDQQNAHAVIGFFIGEGCTDYRLSLVARTSLLVDGDLERRETNKRRYTYILGPGQACRTPAERLDKLRTAGAGASLDNLVDAFKVAPLFKEFYHDYRAVFGRVEGLVQPTLGDREKLRLFTQRLFNRLMFIAFIERKGWLRLGERTDYLAALRDDYHHSHGRAGNFYRDRLVPLFFEGLNQPDRPAGTVDPRFGSVPYLNGGLFERAEDGTDDLPGLVVPDEALMAILDPETGLFSRYNFTVAESTPLEIEVAVDPEMLGKVFEELVTGRHEQGSYYTPKPIVSFMSRAALVEYLTERCPREPRPALEAFVHDHEPGQLRDAESVLGALRTVRICDPACGSGAYLLGMLHELLDLRTHLFDNAKKLDAPTAHERKLEIIEHCLYGVDLDAFAVHIARLRLWLSLAVDFEGTTPPPLPNLDFKIEQGDSLAAPAPQDLFQRPAVLELEKKKAAHLIAHGEAKQRLRADIDKTFEDLSHWQQVDHAGHGFNWGVRFAEVFLPGSAGVSPAVPSGSQEAPLPKRGGFDIVAANPPYVRMELIKPQKPILRKRFPHVHAERADLYIYFYARAHELLREGGVAAFISSNKWLRAGYGESLRQHLLDAQAFRLVMDFGELGVFESAAADAAIFLWQKLPRNNTGTRWAMVKDLDACFAEGVRTHFLKLAVDVPAEQFGKDKPRLATSASADLRSKMQRSGPRLGDLFPSLICWGIKTGLNEAFFLDQTTRDRLVRESPEVETIIRPLLVGDDVRHYEVHYRGSHLIYMPHGIDLGKYPTIEKHLGRYRSRLEKRATEQEWYELQQPSPKLVPILESPKLLYPIIGKEGRFVIDSRGFFINDKVFVLPTSDFYLLGVLNSGPAFSLLRETCVAHGDKDEGGRLEFRAIYLETLPIPDASPADRKVVGDLGQRAQGLHGQRRARVEAFLRELGIDPAQSTSRNPLEQPWMLSAAEFAKRAKKQPARLHEAARDETAALTEEIAKVEAEIDARVAALYGLDVEDQRWAAKAAPGKKDDKQALFFRVLGGLKERHAYFTFDAIKSAVNAEELALKDSSLKVYLSEAVKQGLIHDAGRGWYSRLSEPVRLDPKPVAKLIRAAEKAFPLLDFTVWSTAQLNPWMHHMLAQPVAFLYADSEALESVGEALRESGWDVAINPGKKDGPKAVRPGEKMVVLRPTHAKQPPSIGRQAPMEQILVDLQMETSHLSLMDAAEAQGVASGVLSHHLAQVADMQMYAEARRLLVPLIDMIN